MIAAMLRPMIAICLFAFLARGQQDNLNFDRVYPLALTVGLNEILVSVHTLKVNVLGGSGVSVQLKLALHGESSPTHLPDEIVQVAFVQVPANPIGQVLKEQQVLQQAEVQKHYATTNACERDLKLVSS